MRSAIRSAGAGGACSGTDTPANPRRDAGAVSLVGGADPYTYTYIFTHTDPGRDAEPGRHTAGGDGAEAGEEAAFAPALGESGASFGGG